ncbi:insulinase family protein [Kitasatospora sp. NPDC051853]|uniref:insulinase family protein n=1 Tax=Kitasatospora sp. NPDC051853 TaxID=3364058 RepID=UPI0037A25A22
MTARRPGGARLVVLPAGHRDDGPSRAGFAALLAAVLGDPRCGGAARRAAVAGWITRHRLTARTSEFAYWAPDPAGPRTAFDDLRQARLPAGAAGRSILDDLRARQGAAVDRHGAPPLAMLNHLVERAARSEPLTDPGGTRETLAAITVADLNDAIETLVPRARVHHDHPGTEVEDEDGNGADQASATHWRGALEIALQPECDARVAVRLPVRTPEPGLLPLLVELLGNGPNGRLHRALRHRHHLAYGFTASCWQDAGSSSIGATATVAPQDAATALRVLAHTLRTLADGAGPDETRLAHSRHRAEHLNALDGPFGTVDDLRRRAVGEPTVRQHLSALARFDEIPGLAFLPHPPAAAAVGPFTPEHRDQLARAYQEIR